MRTTTRGLYALKSLLALACNASSEKPVPLHRLAEDEGISPEFLQQIFFKMRKAGLVAAYRGPGGGFYLAKDPKDISIQEILLAAGETLSISPCKPCDCQDDCDHPCDKLDDCKASKFWLELQQEISNFTGSRKLSDFL